MATTPARKPGLRKTSVDELVPHPENPRFGDVGAIVVSIQTNGWFGTLVAQCSTGHVLAGNHRLQAAKLSGLDKVPVHWVDVDDATALRILLADNRTSDLAANDDQSLSDLLKQLAQLEDGLMGTGYDDDDVDALLRQIEYDQRDLGDVMDEWQGMPDYDQPNRERAYRTIVSFETDEDADKFFAKLGITKTMDFWYPKDSLANSTGLNRKWVNDGA